MTNYKYLEDVSIKNNTEITSTVQHINSLQPSVIKDGNTWCDIPFKFQTFKENNETKNFLCNLNGEIDVKSNLIKKEIFFETESSSAIENKIVIDKIDGKYKYFKSSQYYKIGSSIEFITYDYNSTITMFLLKCDDSYYVYSYTSSSYQIIKIDNTFLVSSEKSNLYDFDKYVIPFPDYTRDERLSKIESVTNILSGCRIHSLKYLSNTTDDRQAFSIVFFDKTNRLNVLFRKYNSDIISIKYDKLIYNTNDIPTIEEYKNKKAMLFKDDILSYNNKKYLIPNTMEYKSNRNWIFNHKLLGLNTKFDNLGEITIILPQDLSSNGILTKDINCYLKYYTLDETTHKIISTSTGVSTLVSMIDKLSAGGDFLHPDYFEVFINGEITDNTFFTIETINDDTKLIYSPKLYSGDTTENDTNSELSDGETTDTPFIKKYSVIKVYRQYQGDGINIFNSYLTLGCDVECDNIFGGVKSSVKSTDMYRDGKKTQLIKNLTEKYGEVTQANAGYDEVLKKLYNVSSEYQKISFKRFLDVDSVTEALKDYIPSFINNGIEGVIHENNRIYTNFNFTVSYYDKNIKIYFVIEDDKSYYKHDSFNLENDTTFLENIFEFSNEEKNEIFSKAILPIVEPPEIQQRVTSDVKNALKSKIYLDGVNFCQLLFEGQSIEIKNYTNFVGIKITLPNSINFSRYNHVEIVSLTITFTNEYQNGNVLLELLLFGNKTHFLSLNTDINPINPINGIYYSSPNITHTISQIIPNKNISFVDNTKENKIYQFLLADGYRYFKREKYYFREITLPKEIRKLDFDTTSMEYLSEKKLNQDNPDFRDTFILQPAVAMIYVASEVTSENHIKSVPCLVKIRNQANMNQDFSYYDSLIKSGYSCIKDIYMENIESKSNSDETKLSYYIIDIQNINSDVTKMRPSMIASLLQYYDVCGFYETLSEMNNFTENIESYNLYSYSIKNQRLTKKFKVPKLVVKKTYRAVAWNTIVIDEHYSIAFKNKDFNVVDFTLNDNIKTSFKPLHTYKISENISGKIFEFQSNDIKIFKKESHLIIFNRNLITGEISSTVFNIKKDFIFDNDTDVWSLCDRKSYKNCILIEGNLNKILSDDIIIDVTNNMKIKNVTNFNQIPLIDFQNGLFYIVDDNGEIVIKTNYNVDDKILNIYDNIQQSNFL